MSDEDDIEADIEHSRRVDLVNLMNKRIKRQLQKLSKRQRKQHRKRPLRVSVWDAIVKSAREKPQHRSP